jgi:16S rRNA (guanine527-N7)-methyltransferase
LALPNVTVSSKRAEDLLKSERFELVTARAVAPLVRALGTFAPWKPGVRALFYKGPDADAEIAEATSEARKRQVHLEVAMTYSLPDDLGSRTIVEISR